MLYFVYVLAGAAADGANGGDADCDADADSGGANSAVDGSSARGTRSYDSSRGSRRKSDHSTPGFCGDGGAGSNHGIASGATSTGGTGSRDVNGGLGEGNLQGVVINDNLYISQLLPSGGAIYRQPAAITVANMGPQAPPVTMATIAAAAETVAAISAAEAAARATIAAAMVSAAPLLTLPSQMQNAGGYQVAAAAKGAAIMTTSSNQRQGPVSSGGAQGGSNGHRCDECGDYFHNAIALSAHLRHHVPILCILCGAIFQVQRSYMIHVDTAHTIRDKFAQVWASRVFIDDKRIVEASFRVAEVVIEDVYKHESYFMNLMNSFLHLAAHKQIYSAEWARETSESLLKSVS